MKFVFLFLLIVTVVAHAQNECGTTLARAQKSYEIGNFPEVIRILTPCLAGGFSNDEKWQGYRLLSLAFLFLDDSARADSAIGKMLEINPLYRAQDPVEFQRLLNGYRTFPRFRAGIKA